MDISEVIVYTDGDSAAMKTWSNVPYLLTQTLAAKGVAIQRVSIKPRHRFYWLYDQTLGKWSRWMHGPGFGSVIHTRLYAWWVRRVVRRAERAHPKADAHLFISFSHSAHGLSDKPSVLFCDWTIDYHFTHFAQRQPALLERQAIERQDAVIEQADVVVVLFPGVAEHMRRRYANPNIHYLGNVINAVEQADVADVDGAKMASRRVLMIGRRHYLAGARMLVQACRDLQAELPGLELHIIGMDDSDIPDSAPWLHCHGYLDKAIDAQRALYYQLLREARVVVNTTPRWGAFSSMAEAMYFHCPVITTPYPDFVQTFGEQIDFGWYCKPESDEDLRQALRESFTQPGYRERCVSAHAAVRDFTWSSYVDKLLALMRRL
jgi:glycosyltransferase involved in cell wall biosynthesis